MQRYKIIGTSHISPESIKMVRTFILENRPQIVAVELDKKRYHSLTSGGKQRLSISDMRRVGVKGYLFALAGGYLERKLGAKMGVMPGAEMLSAVACAQEVGAKVALIDQDIEVTLRKFSAALTWREKGRFVVDIIKGVVFRKGLEFDPARVPPSKLIRRLLREVKERYPNVHRVLVEERNEYMARRLAHILLNHPDDFALAVVGAGHEEEMNALLKKYLNTEHDNRKEKDGAQKLR